VDQDNGFPNADEAGFTPAHEEPFLLEPADESSAKDVPVLAPCWRCGRETDVDQPCASCRARPRHLKVRGRTFTQHSDSAQPFKRLMIGYVIMMIPSVIWGLILLHGDHNLSRADVDTGTMILEGFDTVLTLAMLAWIGWLPVARPDRRVRLRAWLAAPVLLMAVLGINIVYHRVLRDAIRPDWMPESRQEFTGFTLLMIAVQPAIVEELFFRYLAFGVLSRIAGTHWGVFISATLFALAHLYQPLGLPWLLVMGVVLGYLRVASGGLLLPMLMHFAHNAIVLGIEAAR